MLFLNVLCFIKDYQAYPMILLKLEPFIFCDCGSQMEFKQSPNLVYDSGGDVLCDCCETKVDNSFWHCKKGKSYFHPDGYDLCVSCAQDNFRL